MKNPYKYLTDRIVKYTERIVYYLITLILRLHYRLYGIKLGKKCYFYGFPKITTRDGGKIIIHNRARFRSTSTSNLIGINHRCIISTLSNEAVLEIGEECGLSGTIITAEKSVKLGKNVRCGANSVIIDTDYHTDDPRSGAPRPVYIKDNVWLGVNSIVLKGVTIGENTVIGANSVVSKDIPPNVIAAGNPCKVIRKFT